MSINFDTALGIHPLAVKIRAQRSEVLANNIANADTPGFKARDIDFNEMLDQAQSQKGELTTTNAHHISLADDVESNAKYRIPLQPSLDGNTVDEQVESSQFTENSLRYLASLQFLDGKFKGLRAAIRGE